MSRLEDLFTKTPTFTCEELGKRATDLSNFDNIPITFPQADFWIFFAVVFAVYAMVHKNHFLRTLFIVIASYFFYIKTSGLFFVLLIISTVIDYFIGNAIHKSTHEQKRKWLLAASMTSNLFILGYFKYAFFFTDSYNALFHTNYEYFNHFAYWSNSFFGYEVFCVDQIILPVGISFYTFQTMSYSIDIYRRQLEPVRNILDFTFFVTFFPQLVAGPIVRAKDFIPQMYQPYSLTRNEFGSAVYMILKGLIKKMVLADYIAIHFIDKVFEFPHYYPGFIIVFALWGYSLQIYGDFSGYTDIAIGVSKLFGYNLNKNFDSPYKANSVADFWRRWHISLSSFLRDYLYIPLGGNKKATWVSYLFIPLIIFFIAGLIDYYWDIRFTIAGTTYLFNFYVISIILFVFIIFLMFFKRIRHFVNTDINLMITMLLGGFWHGAYMKFIIWGGLNGLGLVFYKFWKRISPWENKNGWVAHFWKVFLTFNFISFTRIYFRSPNMNTADTIISQLFHKFNYNNELMMRFLETFYYVLIVMVIGYIVHWLPVRTKNQIETRFATLPIPVIAFISVATGVFVYQFYSGQAKAFEYFMF